MFEKDNKGLNTETEKCTAQLLCDFDKLIKALNETGEKLSPVSLNDIKEKIFTLTGQPDPKRNEETISPEYLQDIKYTKFLKDLKKRPEKPNQKLS